MEQLKRYLYPDAIRWRRNQSSQKSEAEATPVQRDLQAVRRILGGQKDRRPIEYFGEKFDLYQKLETYLRIAKEAEIETEAMANSCFDLAQSTTIDTYTVYEMEEITRSWKKDQEAYSGHRPPREIFYNLDPQFFAAIASGEKPIEGRAYNPYSPKRYQDIRAGDNAVFAIQPDLLTDCEAYNLDPMWRMQAEIEEVVHAPRVHWMYARTHCKGHEFQPMISGSGLLEKLQQAAVYYEFPEYNNLIWQHGFLGLRLKDPQIIQE